MVLVVRVLLLVLCVVPLTAPVCAQQIAKRPVLQESPEEGPAPRQSERVLSREGIAAAQASSPLPFIGLTPCRIIDTRGNGFTGQYGPPSLAQGSARNFQFLGQCGIPFSAEAVSLNITVTNTQGPGFIVIYPQGNGSAPLVSTLNYLAGQTVANAAIVPIGSGGDLTVVAGVSGTDLIIDVNGYYGSPAMDLSNAFLGTNAGNATTTGINNVGVGMLALQAITSGNDNTAVGRSALFFNDSGFENTAFGSFALFGNRGNSNTAVGKSALRSGISSTANTAVGWQALYSNADGFFNVAIGGNALFNITTGSDSNIAVGYGAALNLTSGSNNIHIGHPALSSESNTIRIGTGGTTHTKFFVAGVRGIMTGRADAAPVVIDSGGQLGTISSSAKVKREIADIGEESSALFRLRPVSFLYRNDTVGIRQYGLIAEEVAEVMPELVQFSEAGDPETVRYHFLPSLLLNEFQKQRKTIEQQNEIIAALEARLARLEAALRPGQSAGGPLSGSSGNERLTPGD